MLQVKLLNLAKTLHLSQVESVTLPLLTGEVQILPGHAESFFILGEGVVKIKDKSGIRELKISRGQGHFAGDKLIIFYDA